MFTYIVGYTEQGSDFNFVQKCPKKLRHEKLGSVLKIWNTGTIFGLKTLWIYIY